MDLNVYEKTRYQNIYRHKKNKNYVVMISSPAKTSISKIDNKKIQKIEDALKIRDNPKIKLQKGNEAIYKEEFDDLWGKYISACKDEKHLAFNTVKKKIILFNKYIKNSFNKRISKITKAEVLQFIKKLNCSDKQKNEILNSLKGFFSWCVDEEYILISPTSNIKPIKTEKIEMKFWTPDELKQFLSVLEADINDENIEVSLIARRTRLFVLIEFSLGNRVGETRALTFNAFNPRLNIVTIYHSINYEPDSKDFLGSTKNYHSQRVVDVTDRLIDEVLSYKSFLIEYTNYEVNNEDLIFFNYSTKRPYSDTTLRKQFYHYCEKAGVTKIRMYDLRHTYVATMMAEGKELYHISGRIGHINYSTTVNKYGHLSNKTKKEIASITDKYI